jgi:hypothetical protein
MWALTGWQKPKWRRVGDGQNEEEDVRRLGNFHVILIPQIHVMMMTYKRLLTIKIMISNISITIWNM